MLKNDKNLAGSVSTWLYIVACTVLIFLIVKAAPMMWDDYQFQYTVVHNENGSYSLTGARWSNFDDFLYSFIHHRDCQNSRLGNHVFLMIAYIGGMPLCTVLNTAVLIATWLLLVLYSCSKLTVGRLSYCLLFAALLLAKPERVLLWRDACVNYAYDCLLLILMLMELKKKDACRTWMLCLLSFLCSAWHEGMAIPLCGGSIAYAAMIYIRERNAESKKYLFIGICSLLGMLWLLTSPHFVNSRLSQAAGSAHDLAYYAGSCYRVLLYMIPALVVYCCLVWKNRKNLLSNYYFYLASANLVPTVLVFAKGGAYGGGSFFCTFSILLFLMTSSEHFLERKSHYAYSVVGAALSFIYLAFALDYVTDARKVYDDIMAQDGDAPVRRCDYFCEGEIPWILKAPFYNSHEPMTYAGKYFGKPEFTVVYNQKVKDESVYAAFDSFDDTETTWLRLPEYSVIRFKKGMVPVFRHSFKGNDNYMSGKNGKVHLHCSFETDWLARLLLPFTSKSPFYTVYYSYANGHYFAIYPKEANQMDTAKIAVYNEDSSTSDITVHPTSKE